MERLTTVVKWTHTGGLAPEPEASVAGPERTPIQMAKTAKTEPTATDSVDVVLEQAPYCADGCGSRVNSPKSTFLQGHDQKLIADLSTRVAVGEMGPFQRALLGLVDSPKPAEGEFSYIETGDIMDRINTVDAAMAIRFSAGLAGKFTSAAMAKWDKSLRRNALEAAKAERAANPKPKRARKSRAKATDEPAPAEPIAVETDVAKSTAGQPIENLRGTEVKVKIGRWTYDAIVTGMNRAGKISAVEYTNKKGDSVTTDKFALVN